MEGAPAQRGADPARGVGGVAVVVPTHNRADLLPRLIAGLELQLADLDFEVLIIDDASTDNTPAVLDSYVQHSPLRLRVIRQPRNRGPATARNIGWRTSSAEIIAFTDDDCAPEAGWLRGLAEAIKDVDIAQGRTIADPREVDNMGPFSRTLVIGHEDGFYQTCNIAYRRSVLESVGGFDEDFRFAAGEDTDLAWRAREGGARTVFCENAVVEHVVRPSNILVALRDTWRWQSAPQTVSKHPSLRAQLWRRYIWKPAHRLVLVALPGIALAIVAPWLGSWALATIAWVVAFFLLAPYARHRVRREKLPGTRQRDRLMLLPVTFILDGAEVLACVVGSIRFRTLLL